MAGAPRKRLPSGYDEDFVSAVEDDFQCLICHLPLKEPLQTRCGHRFCKECLEENFTRLEVQNQPLSCPMDMKHLDRDRDVFPDKATERKILSFAIKCPSDGCDWTWELRNKEAHLASCLFKLVLCTNDNCHVTVQREDLEEHVTITCQWRIINCDHCSEPHPECKMKDHIAKCSKFPVCCPNTCGGLFAREMISKHTKDDCLLTVISCPYEEMGCETKVQREHLEAHLQSAMRQHLDLACVKLNKTEKKLSGTKAELRVTNLKLQLIETELNLTETKLNNTEAELKDTKVKLNDTEKKLAKTTKQVAELNTRTFVWKITNFRNSLRHALTGNYRIESAPFYTVVRTDDYGYKLKAYIGPNSDGSVMNTHLSVFIIVMKGEYDAILPWPFKKKVKFTLIDQQENPAKREDVTMQFIPDNSTNTAFARPTQEQNTGYGFPQFISYEKLQSRRYFVDDTLFLQVEIGP